ncbi:MAG: glycoside hydrolase family 65 protein, partial [Lachnospiraceae bacterium]|nr:glycoside hydrolase family 65 protein [Lachnospiraceae bacterium]
MNADIFEKNGYDPESVVTDGNRFLIANGYLGIRGTVEEADRSSLPAVNLAGVYDRYEDKWREPVNAPMGLYAKLSFGGRTYALGEAEPFTHKLAIDYGQSLFMRETDFGPVKISSERLASLAQPHLTAASLTLSFCEDGEAVFKTGISTDIWDLNGPHLFGYKYTAGETLLCEAATGEKNIGIAVSQSVSCSAQANEEQYTEQNGIFRELSFAVKSGEKVTVSIFSAVYTGLDTDEPAAEAIRLCAEAKQAGYELCRSAHAKAWDEVWQRSEITLEGDADTKLALKASQYYLNSIAPRQAGNLSIPARGLSGQTYKGAIFWDSEIFLFPMFVYTQPEVAASILRYRIETLPGALKKAAEYGYRGAFYAWESQEGGIEGCTNFNVVDVFTHRPVRTYFRDKQIHISADIAYALWEYYRITGDRTLLEEGGAEVILECARFYLSRASAHLDGEAIDFTDVIGPDEYHERVTNNAFTNRMIRRCMENALSLEQVFEDKKEMFGELLDRLDYRKDIELLGKTIGRIVPAKIKDGVIEQFDGYFDLEDCSLETVRSRLVNPREYWGGDHGVAGTTQIIKQADVIAMMALFPEDFTENEVEANWEFYEPRTEHGSSLSACMYALTACRIGRPEQAWKHFVNTAS